MVAGTAQLASGSRLGFDSRQEQNLFLVQRVKTVSGVHPTSYLVGTEKFVSEDKTN
jgi:hypothetical protein